jgi:hypothetical protein
LEPTDHCTDNAKPDALALCVDDLACDEARDKAKYQPSMIDIGPRGGIKPSIWRAARRKAKPSRMRCRRMEGAASRDR